jgi:hypothetical protein
MTIFYLDACLPTSIGTLNYSGQAGGDGGREGWGRKKLENGFERFYRGSRSEQQWRWWRRAIGEFGVPTWLSERKQNAGSQESRGFNSEDRVHFLAFNYEKDIATRATRVFKYEC